MRALVPGLMVVATVLAAPAAYADPLCDAVTKVAAAAPSGFTAIRGAYNAAAHTSSFDVYATRVVLPGAQVCSISVPEESGLGPPEYACEFLGSAGPKTTIKRLAAKLARCVGADLTLTPPILNGPEGPVFGFSAGNVRYDLSAARSDGKRRPWVITLNVDPVSPNAGFDRAL